MIDVRVERGIIKCGQTGTCPIPRRLTENQVGIKCRGAMELVTHILLAVCDCYTYIALNMQWFEQYMKLIFFIWKMFAFNWLCCVCEKTEQALSHFTVLHMMGAG